MEVTVTGVLVEALSNEEFVGFCKGEAIICMADGELNKARDFLSLALEAQAPEEPKPKKAPKKPLDHGKIIALHKAGWSMAKIADEMNCSQGAVYSHIKAEAEKVMAEEAEA